MNVTTGNAINDTGNARSCKMGSVRLFPVTCISIHLHTISILTNHTITEINDAMRANNIGRSIGDDELSDSPPPPENECPLWYELRILRLFDDDFEYLDVLDILL